MITNWDKFVIYLVRFGRGFKGVEISGEVDC